MKKLIACEIGNFDSKTMDETMVDIKTGEYKTEPITILNMISIGHSRRSYSNNLSETKGNELINLLDVTIETEIDSLACGHWFVGGLAFKDGKKIRKPNTVSKKSTNPQTIVMLLTSLAYALYDPQKPKKSESIKLGTLLPIEEYFPNPPDTTDYENILREKLSGKKSTVKFNDGAFQEAEITIIIDDPDINPEGAAAQIACIYNWDATVKKELKGLEHKTTMNIDFGSIDTNVSILQNGDFLEKGIFGFKGGTTEVFKNIAEEINAEKGYLYDPFKLDYHVRTNRPLMLGDEDIIELLKKKTKESFSKAGWTMGMDIIGELEDRGIIIDEISIINYTGGGSQFFKDDVNTYIKRSYTKVTEHKNPRFANVEGVLKQLVFERLAAESNNKDVFES